MKTYNPPLRICPQCGKTFVTRNPQAYVYKRRDWRPGHRGRTLMFCGYSCVTAWDKIYMKEKSGGEHYE